MTGHELVQLFWDRSDEAAEVLEAQYGAYCRAVAGNLLLDERDVEECVNDCWLAVWRAIPPARPEHFKGWLAAIVRNRALAIGRENGRRPETVEEAALELAACLGWSVSKTKSVLFRLRNSLWDYLSKEGYV